MQHTLDEMADELKQLDQWNVAFDIQEHNFEMI